MIKQKSVYRTTADLSMESVTLINTQK